MNCTPVYFVQRRSIRDSPMPCVNSSYSVFIYKNDPAFAILWAVIYKGLGKVTPITLTFKSLFVIVIVIFFNKNIFVHIPVKVHPQNFA